MLILILNFSYLKSQTTYQQAYWFQLGVKVKINEKLSCQADADYRRFLRPTRQFWQTFDQMRVHFRFLPKWETVTGMSYTLIGQNDLPVPEWRPFQDIQYHETFGKSWELLYRVRLEERFIHHTNKGELVDGFAFKARPRLRVQLNKTFNDNWAARLSEEYWYQIGDGYNQNQVWLTAERQLKYGFSLELTYVKVNLKRSPSGYYDRDSLRFALIKSFNILKT